MCLLTLVAACCWLCVSLSAHASNIRVASGKCELVASACELKIEASGLTEGELGSKGPPAIVDVSGLEPKLTFENQATKTIDGPGGTRTWSFLVKVTGTPPSTSQERKIDCTLGANPSNHLLFTLTSAAKDSGSTSSIKWTLSPPATPWNLAQDRWTEFTVTRADKDLASITLKHSTYMDSRAGRGWRIALDQFYLCKERTADLRTCSRSAELIGSTSTFWLTINPDFDRAGTFTGNLEIETLPISDIKSISPVINQTSDCSHAIGLFCILVGVTAAWLILAFARGRLSRNQALLPAVLLRERAAGLVLDLDRLPEVLKSTPIAQHALAQIVTKLDESYLDAQQFLPPRVPSSSGSAAIQAAAYQSFLQNQSQLVDDLDAIVTQGIVPASRKWSPTMTDSDLDLLKKLIGELDALAILIPQPLSVIQTNISNLLANWHPTVKAQTAGAAALTISSPPPKGKLSFQILLQIEAITILFWVVWAVLSTLAGFLVLILPNPGFGGGLDYVQCLLWGFGLPVAGQSLQQLSVSSINTQLGITLPKP